MFIFLEDGDWSSADEYCEKVLDLAPENGEAYLGKLMAELKVSKRDNLKNYAQPFDSSSNYQKIMRYGDDALKTEMKNCTQYIKDRNHRAYQESVYQKALSVYQNMSSTKEEVTEARDQFNSISGYKDADEYVRGYDDRIKEIDYRKALSIYNELNSKKKYKITQAKKLFEEIADYKDSAECIKKCDEKLAYLENRKKQKIYDSANEKLAQARAASAGAAAPAQYQKAIELLNAALRSYQKIRDFQDSAGRIQECEGLIAECKEKKSGLESAAQQAAEAAARAAARKKKIKAAVVSVVAIIAAAAACLVIFVVIPEMKYNNAVSLMNAGKYDEAITAFEAVNRYKDSAAQMENCKTAIYDNAVSLMNEGKYDEAAEILYEIKDYKDSSDKLAEIIAEPASISAKNSAFISAGDDHTVGLKKDGTVVAVGDNYYGQCNGR